MLARLSDIVFNFFLTTIMLVGGIANAQPADVTLGLKIGGNGTDRINDMVTDAWGNIFVSGSFNGIVDFDPGPGTASLVGISFQNWFLLKLDNQGQFLWVKQLEALTLATDCMGNVYAAGVRTAAKLDPMGNIIWTKDWQWTTTSTAISSIDVDADGSIVATGYFDPGNYFGSFTDLDPGPSVFPLSTMGGTDVFVVKLDKDGQFLWAKSIGSPVVPPSAWWNADDYGAAVTVNKLTGDIYVTGDYRNTVDFDPGPGVNNITSVAGLDVFVLALDASGVFKWAKSVGGTGNGWGYGVDGNDFPCDIAVHDQTNEVVVTGRYGWGAPVDFDPGPGVYNLNSAGGFDIFLLKLNENGDFVWAGSVGGWDNDHPASVTTDLRGNIYLAGSYFLIGDFDPGPGTFNMSPPVGPGAMFNIKTDPTGSLLWAKQMVTGHGANLIGAQNMTVYERFCALSTDDLGNVYGSGDFFGTINLDPGVSNLSASSHNTSVDAFVYKISQPQIPLRDTLICKGESVSVALDSPYYSTSVLNGDATSLSCTNCPQVLIAPQETTTYLLHGPDPCKSVLDTMVVAVELATISIGADTSICDGPLLLSALSTVGQIEWQNGSTQEQFLVDTSGIYWAEVTSANGCNASDTINVTVRTNPQQSLGADLLFCREDEINIPLSITVPLGGSFTWSDGSTTPNIYVTDSGTFWVMIENSPCPVMTDSMKVSTEICDCVVSLPSAFSPNSDGNNDLFRPVMEDGCPVKGVLFHIYNRWGQRVFSAFGNSVFDGWDGFFSGERAELGTYHYEIALEYGTRHKRYHKKGDVTLIR